MESKQKVGKAYLTVVEAAQLTGFSHWTVRSWLFKGLLTRYKRLSRTVVCRSELLDLLKPKKTCPAKQSARQGATRRLPSVPLGGHAPRISAESQNAETDS
jgi:hypothetical protein